MSINHKLNLIAIIYTVGAFLFQPLASIIQLGMLIYLSMRREWKYFSYGALLFTCSAISGFIFYKRSFAISNELYILLLATSVFANLFWFSAATKQLKRILAKK